MGSNIRLLGILLNESFRQAIRRPGRGLSPYLHRIIQSPPNWIRVDVSSGYAPIHLKPCYSRGRQRIFLCIQKIVAMLLKIE
jgi:hypothetical protein